MTKHISEMDGKYCYEHGALQFATVTAYRDRNSPVRVLCSYKCTTHTESIRFETKINYGR